ncbi:MAG: dihydrolipoyl dehydrogenase [Spirochaetes bacterium GWF1_51_8]|nr:MAG: dihydrolipoyl dehydrogenase [Spirochaetes bacterium GWF1_51_8]
MPEKHLKADVTVLGGGPGGYVAAIRAAQLGANVALVERDLIGGTCLNYGCIPTKALIRSADIYRTVTESKNFGCNITGAVFDWSQAQSRKARVVTTLRKGIEGLLAKKQITVIAGEGKVSAPDLVSAGSGNDFTAIETKKLIIATGAKTALPNIPGIDIDGVMTSTGALELKELPGSLVIIGAGVIGIEFAFLFAALGVQVTVIEVLDRPLPLLDIDISAEIADSANRNKIGLFCQAKVAKFEKAGDKIRTVFTIGGEEKTVEADKIIVAAGRKPNLDGIDAKQMNLVFHPDRKAIAVDHGMRTSRKGVYAIGDVTNVFQLAHVASMQGETAAENAMGMDSSLDYSAVPWAVFSHPEIAVVGAAYGNVNQKGVEAKTLKFPFAAIGKSAAYGERRGFVKLYCDSNNGRVMGAAIVGPGAPEMIHEITFAIRHDMTADNIVKTIHAHPSFSEAIRETAMMFDGEAIHFGE